MLVQQKRNQAALNSTNKFDTSLETHYFSAASRRDACAHITIAAAWPTFMDRVEPR